MVHTVDIGAGVWLVQLVVRVTILLVATSAVALALGRASAGARQLVWALSLGCVVVLPLLTLAFPWRLEMLPADWSIDAGQYGKEGLADRC